MRILICINEIHFKIIHVYGLVTACHVVKSWQTNQGQHTLYSCPEPAFKLKIICVDTQSKKQMETK